MTNKEKKNTSWKPVSPGAVYRSERIDGYALRTLRVEARYTQRYVAHAMGYSVSSYGQLERKGVPLGMEKVRKFADAVGVSVALVMSRIEELRGMALRSGVPIVEVISGGQVEYDPRFIRGDRPRVERAECVLEAVMRLLRKRGRSRWRTFAVGEGCDRLSPAQARRERARICAQNSQDNLRQAGISPWCT